VARGVITIGAELGLDQIGIPSDTAWPMYAPYVQRRLVQSGMSMSDALKNVKGRTAHAKKMLDLEMKSRPVRYSRAPSWHKFNVIAGHPTIVEGSNIRINPFVTSGMNADFDGDQINLHVPASAAAVSEAYEKLLPSKMLFSIRDQERVQPLPKHEHVLGLYAANARPARQVHKFPDHASAMKAIHAGDISLQDEVDIPDLE
jgi:DNA-directed RNA polymerase subunit beta'